MTLCVCRTILAERVSLRDFFMKFRLGINYWPINNAMYWWRRFETDEFARDSARIRAADLIFGLWREESPKRAVEIIREFGGNQTRDTADLPWIDIEPEEAIGNLEKISVACIRCLAV